MTDPQPQPKFQPTALVAELLRTRDLMRALAGTLDILAGELQKDRMGRLEALAEEGKVTPSEVAAAMGAGARVPSMPPQETARRIITSSPLVETQRTRAKARRMEIGKLFEGGMSRADIAKKLDVHLTSVYADLKWLAENGLLQKLDASLRRHMLAVQAPSQQADSSPSTQDASPSPPQPSQDEPQEAPKSGNPEGLDFGDVVFVRFSGSGGVPTYMRCTVVSLPDEAGDFVVKNPDGANLTLKVRDKVAPFRDKSPTFSVDIVERRPVPQGPSSSNRTEAPKAPVVTRSPEAPPPPEVGVTGKKTAPFGTSFDFTKSVRPASIPELRAEAIKRQRGASGKAVQFATTFVDGYAHVASVDRMGYGTTIKDPSGHVHRIMKWEVMDAVGCAPHSGPHRLTLLPPTD